MRFLEQAGCPLKTERGGRVFPVSDHSSDIIAAFERELRKLGVEILLNTEVIGLMLDDTEDAEGGKSGAALDVQGIIAEGEYRVKGVRLSGGRILSGDR